MQDFELYILALILKMSLVYINIIISLAFYEQVNWSLEKLINFSKVTVSEW